MVRWKPLLLVAGFLVSAAPVRAAVLYPTRIFDAPVLTSEAQDLFDGQKLTVIEVVPDNKGLTYAVFMKATGGRPREPISDPARQKKTLLAISQLFAGETVPGTEIGDFDLLIDGKSVELEFYLTTNSSGTDKKVPDATEQLRLNGKFRSGVFQNYRSPRLENFASYQKNRLFFGVLLNGQPIAAADSKLEDTVSELVSHLLEGAPADGIDGFSLEWGDGKLLLKEMGTPKTQTVSVVFFRVENKESFAYVSQDDRQLQTLLSRHARFLLDRKTEKPKEVAPKVKFEDLAQPSVVTREPRATDSSETFLATDYVDKKLPGLAPLLRRLEPSYTGFTQMVTDLLPKTQVLVQPYESFSMPGKRVTDPRRLRTSDFVRYSVKKREVEVAQAGLNYLSETDRAYSFLTGLLQAIEGVSDGQATEFISKIHRVLEAERLKKVDPADMQRFLFEMLETEEVREEISRALQEKQKEAIQARLQKVLQGR